MRHVSPEYIDDIYLSELVNSAYEKPPRPWWHWTLLVVGVGVAVLGTLAWVWR